MTKYLHHDPEPDPALSGVLRQREPDVAAAVDWDRLQGQISDRATLPLARRRRSRRPWTLGGIVAVAAAAGVALAVWTNSPPPPAASGPVLGVATEQELERLISGRAEADALLRAVLELPEQDS